MNALIAAANLLCEHLGVSKRDQFSVIDSQTWPWDCICIGLGGGCILGYACIFIGLHYIVFSWCLS